MTFEPFDQEISEEAARLKQRLRATVARTSPRAWFTTDREALADLGCFGLTAPTEFGGYALRPLDYIAIQRELGRYSPSVACSIGAHNALFVVPLARHGSQNLRERWLKRASRGVAIGALGLTESDAGSDISNARTNVTVTETGFTLTGSKAYVTNAPVARLALVFAKKNRLSASLFLVDLQQPGVRVENPLSKVGLHDSPTSGLFFDEVDIDQDAELIRAPKEPAPLAMALAWGRLSLAAGSLGLLDKRRPDLPAFRKLALETAVRFAGCAIEEDRPWGHDAAAFAKLLLSEDACALLSASGRDYSLLDPVNREAAMDARAFRVFEGTSEVLRLFVVKRVILSEAEWWRAGDAGSEAGDELVIAARRVEQRLTGLPQHQQVAWLRLADWALVVFALTALDQGVLTARVPRSTLADTRAHLWANLKTCKIAFSSFVSSKGEGSHLLLGRTAINTLTGAM